MKPELTYIFGVQRIGLFGSVVRDDFNQNSDVDIIVDFSKPVGIEFIDLANYIEAHLRRKVDLVSRNGMQEKYYTAIEKEIVYV